MRQVPELVRCYGCGNPSTDESPLVWAVDRGKRVVVHNWAPCDDAVDENGERVYPDNDPDTAIPVCGHVECQEDWDPCPAMPDGFGKCANCQEARPLDRLTYTTLREVDPGKGWYGTGQALVRLGIAADRETDTEVACLPSDDPILLCLKGGCADRQRDDRKTTGRVERDEADELLSDQARADAVPIDGEGMAIAGLMTLWGMKERATRNLVARLLASGLLRFEEVATGAGGAPRKVYWRVDR